MDFFGKFLELASCLPPRLAEEIRRISGSYPDFGQRLTEIRARRGQVSSLSLGKERIPLPVVLTAEEIEDSFCRCVGDSLYAHRDGLSEGFITLRSGCRVGVAARAVSENGRLLGVSDPHSLIFRIPRRIVGAGAGAYAWLSVHGLERGLLVFSPPGVGKTTLLLDLAVCLSSGRAPRSVAVIDTRGEFSGMLSEGEGLLDLLTGFDRTRGAEIAVRSLCPDVIVTDEVGDIDEAEALADCVNAGVAVIASAHADSVEDLLRRPAAARLLSKGVVSSLYRLYRDEEGQVSGEGISLKDNRLHASFAV